MTQSLCTNGPSSSLCSFLGRAQKQKIENQSGQPLFAAAIPSVSRILGHEAPPCARSTRGLGDGESGGASEVGARGPEAKTAGPRSTLCVPRVWMPVAGSPLILRGRDGVRTVRGPQAGFSRRCVGVPALSSSPPVRRLQRLVCVPSVRFTCKVTHMLKQSASIRGKDIMSFYICVSSRTLEGSSYQLLALVRHTRAAGAFLPGL